MIPLQHSIYGTFADSIRFELWFRHCVVHHCQYDLPTFCYHLPSASHVSGADIQSLPFVHYWYYFFLSHLTKSKSTDFSTQWYTLFIPTFLDHESLRPSPDPVMVQQEPSHSLPFIVLKCSLFCLLYCFLYSRTCSTTCSLAVEDSLHVWTHQVKALRRAFIGCGAISDVSCPIVYLLLHLLPLVFLLLKEFFPCVSLTSIAIMYSLFLAPHFGPQCTSL